MYNKKIWPIVLLLTLALVAAACSSDSESDSTNAGASTTEATDATTSTTPKKLVIGFSSSGNNLNHPAAITIGIEAMAVELGIELISLDAQSEVGKQSNDIQDLVAQGVDGILFIPIDSGVATSMVDQAIAAGIPIVAVGTPVGDTSVDPKAVYEGLLAVVSQDEVEVGRVAGGLAIEAAPGGAKVAVVEGGAGWAQTLLRQQGFDEATAGANLEIIASQPGDWVPEKAYSACQNMMTANPDVELIFLHSDGMLGGCAKALSELGISIPLIGVGGAKAGIEMIPEGKAYGTVCFKPQTLGGTALEALVNHLRGTKILTGEFISYETPGVTAATIDDCIPQW